MIKFIENIKKLKYNRKLIDTNHSIERFFDKNRFTNTQKEELNKNLIIVANRFLDKIISKDKSGIYGVHSKSTGIGFVVDFRKDNQSSSDINNHLILITLLPIKKFHHFNNVNSTVIVEAIRDDLLYSVYKQSLSSRLIKRLNEGKSIPDYCFINYGNSEHFSIVQEDNKYSFSDLDDFIVIE